MTTVLVCFLVYALGILGTWILLKAISPSELGDDDLLLITLWPLFLGITIWYLVKESPILFRRLAIKEVTVEKTSATLSDGGRLCPEYFVSSGKNVWVLGKHTGIFWEGYVHGRIGVSEKEILALFICEILPVSGNFPVIEIPSDAKRPVWYSPEKEIVVFDDLKVLIDKGQDYLEDDPTVFSMFLKCVTQL